MHRRGRVSGVPCFGFCHRVNPRRGWWLRHPVNLVRPNQLLPGDDGGPGTRSSFGGLLITAWQLTVREQRMKVLVTGGTGTVGSKVIYELLHTGISVRALIRNQRTAKLPVGVETLAGDLLDPVSVAKALEGVDKLYLLNAVAPDELTQGLISVI